MNADGTDLVSWNVPGDLEALTVADHTSTMIYIGVEHTDSILEFDVSTGQVTRTFELTSWMTGEDSKGLEALAFVPDAMHPEGGFSMLACRKMDASISFPCQSLRVLLYCSELYSVGVH